MLASHTHVAPGAPRDAPSHAYYRGCEGAWRAELDLTIADPAALRDSGMGLLDRLSLRLMAAWPRWLGRCWLHTTVACDGAEVLHTTVVRWLGVPLQRSVETIALAEDGSRFEVSGGMVGQGSVDASGTRASYALTWLGAEITQTTVREDDRVTVTQAGPGFTGVQRLTRQPDA